MPILPFHPDPGYHPATVDTDFHTLLTASGRDIENHLKIAAGAVGAALGLGASGSTWRAPMRVECIRRQRGVVFIDQ
ncbi:hypothetical protein GCM10017711_25940 [Paeniglutamicibacter sulfureus]